MSILYRVTDFRSKYRLGFVFGLLALNTLNENEMPSVLNMISVFNYFHNKHMH